MRPTAIQITDLSPQLYNLYLGPEGHTLWTALGSPEVWNNHFEDKEVKLELDSAYGGIRLTDKQTGEVNQVRNPDYVTTMNFAAFGYSYFETPVVYRLHKRCEE